MRPYRKTLSFLSLLLLVTLLSGSRCRSPEENKILTESVGEAAMSYTETLLAFGPRPSGSEGLVQARAWIRSEVEGMGYELEEETFEADTPIGPVNMVNLSFRVPGKGATDRVILMAHYETKLFQDFEFLGANDASSSVALLMAMARAIDSLDFSFDVDVVFVDGEEAFVRWSPEDSLYGSRYFAENSLSDRPTRGAIVIDMVGDQNLQFIRNRLVTAEYLDTLEAVLNDMKRPDLLASSLSVVSDDHLPLLDRGIKTLHLMDFTYGSDSSPGPYWHTEHDTIDKISKESLQVSAEVILRFLEKLEKS